jgi:hypothetical protein
MKRKIGAVALLVVLLALCGGHDGRADEKDGKKDGKVGMPASEANALRREQFLDLRRVLNALKPEAMRREELLELQRALNGHKAQFAFEVKQKRAKLKVQLDKAMAQVEEAKRALDDLEAKHHKQMEVINEESLRIGTLLKREGREENPSARQTPVEGKLDLILQRLENLDERVRRLEHKWPDMKKEKGPGQKK